MKKIALFLAATLIAGSVGTGCSSITEATKFNGVSPTLEPNVKPVAHLNSKINGLYLFGLLPVFSGAVAKTDYTAVFTNTATIDNAFFQMMIYAREKGAPNVIDIVSSSEMTMIFPLFLYMRSAQVSGTAVIPGN